MSKVSYLQRYSQRENHITNNTILVLRHLYQAAPSKLEQVIKELLDEDNVSLGVSFHLQKKGAQSVPDAVISQSPFDLYLEAKPSTNFNSDQLSNHLQSIERDKRTGDKVLLCLATATLQPESEAKIDQEARALGIRFKSVTYEGLLAAVDAACMPYEIALRALVEDYREYLGEEGLLNQYEDTMLIVPCGTTKVENERFGIYYELRERPSRNKCNYIGCYWDKRVGLIGKIESIFICSYESGEIKLLEEQRGRFDEIISHKIKSVIEASTYYPDLKTRDHRFYITDAFVDTNIVKTSKGPVRGAQYMRLSSILGQKIPVDMTTKQLADRLRDRPFPSEG